MPTDIFTGISFPIMNESNPLVSVLMTAYNREQYIAAAIESVQASTYPHFELIIVDDGSRDETVSIARRYAEKDHRIRVYVNEKNLGDYPNRNKAAEYAGGKYLKYIDSDDLIYPHGLEVFVRTMEAFPDAALGFSSRQGQWDQPFPVKLAPQEAFRMHFFRHGFLDNGPVSVIIRSDVFRQSGGFSGVNMTGDTECWMRLAMNHPVLVLAPGLVFWRVHEGQEFQAGWKNDIYLEQNYSLFMDVIRKSEDRLTRKEKILLEHRYKKMTVRGIVKRVRDTGRFGHYFQLYRKMGFRVSDIRFVFSR